MSSSAIRHAPPANPVNAASAVAQVFTLASNALQPVTVAAPGKSAIDGRRFTVRAEGRAQVTTAAYTVKASLLAALVAPATPLVAANWTLLGAGTARAIATPNVPVPWWLEANLIFDSLGGALQGSFSQLANNLFDAQAALANQVTGINATNLPVTQAGTVVQPADPALVFAIALTFGTADAGNIGALNNFEIGF